MAKKTTQKKSAPKKVKAPFTDLQLKKIKETLELIEDGMSLRKALKLKKLSSTVFYNWLDFDTQNNALYARACNERAEAILDEAYEIADDNRKDTIQIYDKEGKPIDIEDKEWTNRSRLRLDLRKWHLSKLNPKKYGDRLDITSKDEKIEAVNVGTMISNFFGKGENEGNS